MSPAARRSWGRQEERRRARGTGGRARLFTSFPQLPALAPPPAAREEARRPGAPRTRGSRLAAAAAAGVRPGVTDEPRGAQVHARSSVHAASRRPGAPLAGLWGARARRPGCAARGLLGGAAGEFGVGADARGRGGDLGRAVGRPGTSGAGVGESCGGRGRLVSRGAARHRGGTDADLPAVTSKVTGRSSQGSQFRRLTGPPPEAAHRTLDPTGPPVSAVPLGGSLGPILSLVDPLEIGHSWGCGSSQGPSPGSDYSLRFACASLAI